MELTYTSISHNGLVFYLPIKKKIKSEFHLYETYIWTSHSSQYFEHTWAHLSES